MNSYLPTKTARSKAPEIHAFHVAVPYEITLSTHLSQPVTYDHESAKFSTETTWNIGTHVLLRSCMDLGLFYETVTVFFLLILLLSMNDH